MAESKEQQFVRLAEKRMSNALRHIRLVGNLGSPGYKKTPYQIECIKQGLENGVAECMARFEQSYQQKDESFSFDNYEPDDVETVEHTDDKS